MASLRASCSRRRRCQPRHCSRVLFGTASHLLARLSGGCGVGCVGAVGIWCEGVDLAALLPRTFPDIPEIPNTALRAALWDLHRLSESLAVAGVRWLT